MFTKRHLKSLGFAIALVSLTAQTTQAHFIFLAPQASKDGKTTVQIYFGEDATPDDPSFLKYTDGMKAWSVDSKGTATELDLTRTDEEKTATVNASSLEDALVVATHDLGVMNRGDVKFRLKYYAKSGPAAGATAWSKIDTSKQLALDTIPEMVKDGCLLHVLFNGKAMEGCEVVASGPNEFDFKGTTGESGTITLPIKSPGVYSIRAKHADGTAGSLEGKDFSETRHYSTLTLQLPSDLSGSVGQTLQPLEQPVTSFGGAMIGDNLYIYGGHTGGAHSYSHKEQDHHVRQLNLKTGEWTVLGEGPSLQGLALVAVKNKLYRIGGFTAKNAEGEEHDLWSQDSVAAFNLDTNKWEEMPSLPEPRSSFDAAVLNGKIYVIGGWKMAGEEDSVWHQTAWVLDPSAEKPEWKAIAEPPFQRRALATAAFNGKIYAIGGMQSKGGPTVRSDVYDPETNEWSQGPELVVAEEPKTEKDSEPRGGFSGSMTGFGASAFATGGQLYVTTINGELQRLSKDGSQFEIVSHTPTARFFHRMLPVSPSQLLVVGGANMTIGKFEEVEILDVSK